MAQNKLLGPDFVPCKEGIGRRRCLHPKVAAIETIKEICWTKAINLVFIKQREMQSVFLLEIVHVVL